MRKLKRNLSKETDYWLGAPRGIPQRFVHLPVLSMYSLTISSVMFPELTARYPLAQTCRPQNLPCRRCGNSCSSTRELIPLSHCIIWLTSWLGRYPTNTCTWSRAHFSRNDFQFVCSAAICRIKSRARTATSLVKTGFRYFGSHTKCTLKSLLVVPPNRKTIALFLFNAGRLQRSFGQLNEAWRSRFLVN